jgi:23S rRNA (adenine-N6)-dimethyltransferase
VSEELRTRWGFHQLTDRWAQRLVDDAHIGERDLVLDIGAGYGALTAPLLATGARVIAFELHPKRARALRTRFAGSRLKVVQADAADLRLPSRPFHVVANPPFAITSSLVRRLTTRRSSLISATLVVPHRAAMRWRGHVKDFDLTIVERVPARAFRPAASSPVVVVRITSRRVGVVR